MGKYVRRCNKCNSIVKPSDNIKYDWQCLECDEDLFEFETTERIEND